MSSTAPLISVVIPAKNEEQSLPAALDALNSQVGLDRTLYEVIVVDNNCTDRTAEIAKSLGAIVVKEPKPGIGHARAAGFAIAKAPLIATTDADSIAPESWLNDILAAFNDPKVVAVGGPVTYDISGEVLHAVVNRSIPYLHEIDRLIHADAYHLIGANMAVRKTAFDHIGGWHAELSLGEDMDLSHRIAKVGKIAFLPDNRVKTSDRRFQTVGPQQLIIYLGNYIELTKPGDAVRKQLESFIERIRNQEK
ncbi:MAG: glycosyltransferase [Patescibacteria group bacterium]